MDRTEVFTSKAKNVHNEYHNYDKTVYRDYYDDKVIITCPLHGNFKQILKNHLIGSGCIKYGRLQAMKTMEKRINTEKFIQDVHGPLYDYSQTKHLNRTENEIIKLKLNINTDVIFKCKTHDQVGILLHEFQSKKSGCPKCKE